MRPTNVRKVTHGNRVFGTATLPPLSKDYADGACFGFEKAARMVLWELCDVCKNKYPLGRFICKSPTGGSICKSPTECGTKRDLAKRLREYKEKMIDLSKKSVDVLFCGNKKRT